ncbi:BTAD domain-containing putative transcriptional regulator [Sphingomonas colocasiae]|uniref:Tetratricopeptide repeat protein n=1 Tax=Sphingomonas colocasiae TaxID=1848973 RepID=A0ABS7PIX0_9SPHN|nr:BTAD domain-containing putative transcriptional regulator [Sphingomonas colocasiae]MBY8821173.1 tetratricopeptide repeat protein [Sphingomonas colocasiae]
MSAAFDHFDESLESSGTSPCRFHLRLAGDIILSGDARQPIVLRTRKSRALIVLLALEDGGLARQRLVDILWPDRPDEQGRASLRQVVYELRATIGNHAILTEQDRVMLAPGTLDHDIGLAGGTGIDELAPILALMRTPFLGGLDGISDELDTWLRDERARLIDHLAKLAGQRAEAALAQDKGVVARDIVDQILRLAPHDERLLRVALRVDAANGDSAQLHRRYQGFSRWLADEMDAAPAQETRALYERLRLVPSSASSGEVPVSPPPGRAIPAVARRRRIWGIGAAAILLCIAASAWFLLLRPARASPPVIAVIPFQQLSGSSSPLTGGISEEVQNRLAGLPGVRIVGRFTANQLVGNGDVPHLAGELGITHLVEGSVQHEGSQLRVIVRLIRVADRSVLWSDRFDRRAGGAFALQSDIAAAVAERFGRSFAQASAPKRPPPLPQVYDRYLAARALIRDRRAAPLAAAERALREAIAMQPDHAPLHALLSQVLILQSRHPTTYGRREYAAAESEARREATLAAGLDPQLAEAQAALGLLTHSDAASLPYYRRAVALDPQRAEFHRWLGQALMVVGRTDEAIAAFRRAVAIDPLWGLSYEHLIVALADTGHGQEVRPVVRRFLALSNDERAKAQLQLVLAQIDGRLADAVQFARRMVELAPEDRQSHFKLASQLAIIGETKAAFAELESGDWLGRLSVSGRYDELARQIGANAETFWQAGSGLWDVNDALIANGHDGLLLGLFDRRFGSAARYRPGEIVHPVEAGAIALAMRKAGRIDESRAIASRIGAQAENALRKRAGPHLLLLDQSVAAVLTGDRSTALDVLERMARDMPDQLLSIPYRPLAKSGVFGSLVSDPRLAAIDRRLDLFVDAERARLGLPPLRQRQ